MRTKYIVTLLLLLFTAQSAIAKQKNEKTEAQPTEKKEIVKTGYNFGPLPAVAFDADKGFQLGALLNIYDFGNGSTYPNTRQQWYMEASFFTKGSQLYVLSYDNRFLIPGVRWSSALTITNEKALDFYGFNGYMSYYDHEKVALGKDKKNEDMYIYTPKYRINRLAILFKSDFVGNLWDNKLFWEAGYHFSYFKQGAINRAKINKNKEEYKMFPDSEKTLFEQYREWGLISDKEANGGINSTVRLGLLFDTRDKEGAPSRGIWAEAHLTAAPKWLGTSTPHYRYSATFRHYIPIVKNDVLTFAYRLNYEGTIGKSAPYYVCPYLTTIGPNYDRDGMGGYRTVRGIMRNRVQGLDMATYTAEIRWRFVNFTLWKQNIAFGLNLFSDGAWVTRGFDMTFKGDAAKLGDDYLKVKQEYDEYMSKGQSKDAPHITAGVGLRFIMNQNFIVAFEYGLPVGKLRQQDGKGAFYINTGYLF
ncbi:MAG: BamA/TamA family outer membrane protein [Alistipes sp.]|jgi:outer membrane protein assembly factor BamA|nr:BamA/TamA family outer membrane protein [Alistipes sp.]MBQ5693321.1 BamA/TamA family outer membrane protein [Alistipes sp.]